MRQEHEVLYRRTIDSFVRNVREGRFTNEAVPRMLDDLRQELGQCVELLLISPEFYSERMEVLGRVSELIESGTVLEG